MKITRQLLLPVFFLMSFIMTAGAQNFAYVHSDSLLSVIPEIQGVKATLETLQAQQVKMRDKMIADFQANYQDLQQRQEQGTITPKDLQEQSAKLEEDKNKISAFEEKMVSDLQNKQLEQMQPILDKVNQAIKDVAKEKGFQYVFDWTAGVLLYADESKDITKLVLIKLGVPTN
jgi:outer membrane protein